MKIKLGKGVAIETDACSLDELCAHKEAIDLVVAQIDLKIGAAIARHQETGNYADPHWMNRARIAIKLARRSQQELMQEIARRRKAQRQLEHNQERPLSDYFVEICKERMAPELYDALIEMALQRKLQAVGVVTNGATEP